MPGAGAGATTTGRVGQGAIAVGASHRGVGERRAGERAFCWLTAWLAVNQSRPRRVPGIEDMDAQANTAFGAATESIRQALARSDGKRGSGTEGKIRTLAMGEALLQHSLSVTPLRIDLWLWRLRIALARRDSTKATELAAQAAAQPVVQRWICGLGARFDIEP